MELLLIFLGGVAVGLLASLIITVVVVTLRKIFEHCKHIIRIQKAKQLLAELFKGRKQTENELSEKELRELLAEDDVVTVRGDKTNVTADDVKIFHGTNGTDVKLSRALDRHPNGVLVDPAAV